MAERTVTVLVGVLNVAPTPFMSATPLWQRIHPTMCAVRFQVDPYPPLARRHGQGLDGTANDLCLNCLHAITSLTQEALAQLQRQVGSGRQNGYHGRPVAGEWPLVLRLKGPVSAYRTVVPLTTHDHVPSILSRRPVGWALTAAAS